MKKSRHHIVPICKGGCDCPSNIVVISQKEHDEYNKRHGSGAHPWTVIKKLEREVEDLKREVLQRLEQVAKGVLDERQRKNLQTPPPCS